MTLLTAIILAVILAAIAVGSVIMIIRLLRERARLRRSLDIAMLQVTMPKDVKEGEEDATGDRIKERIAVGEQFLSTLANLPTSSWDTFIYGKPIMVFEIVARNDNVIVFQVGSERRYIDHLEKQIYALYPEADVTPYSEYTIFEVNDAIQAGSIHTTKGQHLPIATYKELEVDPMQALTGALAKIKSNDAAMIQYILQPAGSRTRRKGAQAARKTVQGKQSDVGAKQSGISKLGKSSEDTQRQQQENAQLTAGAHQRIELVEGKGIQQQFDVNIRIAVSCANQQDSSQVFNAIAGAFSQYNMPDLNSFNVVEHHKPKFLRDIIFRVPRAKTANTLSTTEITSLFHFPLPNTATPDILWRGAKTASAPPNLPGEGVVIGTNKHRGIEVPIHFSREDRRRHMYMIGQTGTGKTTMFLNMIVQDIQNGEGVGVVDPHGDLIEDILLHIPPERADDVILFDPRDGKYPLGFNILEVEDEAQRDLMVNEVVNILQKLAARLNPESVGPMFEHYLRNALLALASDPNATLVDVPRIFVDQAFREKVLANVHNPVVRQFWDQEFAQSQRGQMSADMLSYVISKLGRFIGNDTVRNIIGQAHSSFDVRNVMDTKKILLCNLSKGQIGDINSDLLGFVLVSKIQIAALGRANMPEDQRPDFYLYLDEFQNFTTDSISTILSEARKYRLNLNLTHQFIEQLDEPIQEAVFGNVGTIVSYRVGVDDTEYLAKQFAPVFAEYDLLNLERFTALVRLLANQTPQRPFSISVPAPPSGGDTGQREAIRERSRATYGRSLDIVEAEILERYNPKDSKPTTAPPDSGDYLGESLFDVS